MPRMKRPAPGHSRRYGTTLSIAAYARAIGCTAREVHQHMAEGKLPFVQIAGQLRIDASRLTKRHER